MARAGRRMTQPQIPAQRGLASSAWDACIVPPFDLSSSFKWIRFSPGRMPSMPSRPSHTLHAQRWNAPPLDAWACCSDELPLRKLNC